MSYSIIHNVENKRFETYVDGAYCLLDYRKSGARMTIEHVIVPTAVEGRGIAAALTKSALDSARAEGLTVIPHCPYAAAYIQRHPEYLDLIEST